jgi:hypothetical protein
MAPLRVNLVFWHINTERASIIFSPEYKKASLTLKSMSMEDQKSGMYYYLEAIRMNTAEPPILIPFPLEYFADPDGFTHCLMLIRDTYFGYIDRRGCPPKIWKYIVWAGTSAAQKTRVVTEFYSTAEGVDETNIGVRFTKRPHGDGWHITAPFIRITNPPTIPP